MYITIIDGSPITYNHQNYTVTLSNSMISQGHQVKLIKTAEHKINYCTGCWTCWWKTPGECIHKDEMPLIYRNYLKSDLVLHFSPLEMGFISSKLKTVNDRTVPLVHPYVTLVEGESHHEKRYEKYPFLGLIIDPTTADEEDLQITKDLYSRMALNFKTELKIFTTIHKPMEELINEINHIQRIAQKN